MMDAKRVGGVGRKGREECWLRALDFFLRQKNIVLDLHRGVPDDYVLDMRRRYPFLLIRSAD